MKQCSRASLHHAKLQLTHARLHACFLVACVFLERNTRRLKK